MPTGTKLRRKLRQRLNQIANTVVGDNPNVPNSLRMARLNGYFRDHMIRHAAIREMYPEMDDTHARALADSIDPFTPSDESVQWWMEPKARGSGYRPVCKFGIEMRVRHRLIRAAVDVQLGNGDIFYDRKRQGVSAAIRAIVKSLGEVGPFVLSADIRNCFQSVNIDAVYGLNILPTEVVRYALDYRHLNLRKEVSKQSRGYNSELSPASLCLWHDEGGTGPTGLLQGCSASNAILRHLLFGLDMQVAPDARIFVFADNIYVICATEANCIEALTNLTRHLAGCPAGPFLLGSAEIVQIEDGIDALGYHLIGNGSGRTDVQLSEKSIGKVLHRFANGFRDERRSMEFCSSAEFFGRVLRTYPELSDDFVAGFPDFSPWYAVIEE